MAVGQQGEHAVALGQQGREAGNAEPLDPGEIGAGGGPLLGAVEGLGEAAAGKSGGFGQLQQDPRMSDVAAFEIEGPLDQPREARRPRPKIPSTPLPPQLKLDFIFPSGPLMLDAHGGACRDYDPFAGYLYGERPPLLKGVGEPTELRAELFYRIPLCRIPPAFFHLSSHFPLH